ncbi:protein TOPAZ1 isoform X3 [Dendropsophus ebraccatus]|uniref:protein TOPAZ1 isoform X3 n=1 Tax=Dendropsophus ebraccatus TaxID=150705 RepID=UPI003831AFB0
MIELRPRKLPRLPSSVGVSHRQEGDCAGASGGVRAHNGLGKKRGRKPKVRTPVQCKEPSAAHENLPPKKRGRKPRIASCVKVKLEKSNGKIPSVSLGMWTDIVQQAGTAQNKVASGAVKKRGRKPKIQTHATYEGSGTGNTSCVNIRHLNSWPKTQEQVSACSKVGSQAVRKKRGRKPKIQPCSTYEGSGNTSCVNYIDLNSLSLKQEMVSLCSKVGSQAVRKKRGRKPKIQPCSTYEGLGTCVSDFGLNSWAKKQEQVSACSELGSQAVRKKRGRKPKIQTIASYGVSSTCKNDLGLNSWSKKQEQLPVCSKVSSQDVRKKRERKPGSLLLKTLKGIKVQSSDQEEKGLSCVEKSENNTVYGRVQCCLVGSISNISAENRESNVKEQHPGALHGEDSKSSTELTCVISVPENSRRTRCSYMGKRKIPVAGEQNGTSLMIVSSVLKDEVKSKMSEDSMSVCSTNTCHVHSPELPNPVVKLYKCKSLHLHCSDERLGNVLTTQNNQNPSSLTDYTASDNVGISEKGNKSHNKHEDESAPVANSQKHLKTLLKVKLNFRKKEQNRNNYSEEGNVEHKTVDSFAIDLKNEGQKQGQHCISKPTFSSNLQNVTLMDNLNNNTMVSALLISTKEQNKVGTPWHGWRSQISFASDEEISDQGSDKSSTITVCSSNGSLAKNNVTCQRVIPFTGKHIWRCSCARTYVSALPRKRPADVKNTVILGIEAERSLEIYSDDMLLLCDVIQEREREDNCEAICKKRKMHLHDESTSPHNVTFESTLDESLSNDSKCVGDTLLGISETTNATLILPLASGPARKDAGLDCSNDSETGKALVDTAKFHQLQREDKTQLHNNLPPSKSLTDQKIVAEPVLFKIPNDETTTLLNQYVPVVCKMNKDLNSELCPQSMENGDTSALTDNVQSSEGHSGGASSCYPSECFDKGGSIDDKNACDTSITLASASTKMSASGNTLDLLKAYEEDMLVLDVIPDDPELFGFSTREDRSPPSKKCCNTSNSGNSSQPKSIPSISKVHKKPVIPGYESKTCITRIEYVPEKRTDFVHDCINDHSTYSLGLPAHTQEIATAHTNPRDRCLAAHTHEMTTNGLQGEDAPGRDTEPRQAGDQGLSTGRGCPQSRQQDAELDQPVTCNSVLGTKESATQAETEERVCPRSSQDKDNYHHALESHHANISDESESSTMFQDAIPDKHLSRPQQPLFHQMKLETPIINTSSSPWMPDFHSSRMVTSQPDVAASGGCEQRRHEKPNHFNLPYGYCKFFFYAFPGCLKQNCSFVHIPKMCDEKVCMDMLRNMINEKKIFLLIRAAFIFRSYYSQYPPRHHYDRDIFEALLKPLLFLNLWKDLFDLLETAAEAKIFPSLDQIVQVFQRVASSGIQQALSTLLNIFCKLVHNGMNVTPVEINQIITIMGKSSASQDHMNIILSMKSSLEMKNSKVNWAYRTNEAIAEVEHCKVNNDWVKLGTLYLAVCTGCENLTTLKNFSRCVAGALINDSIIDRPEIPFCEFADAVFKNPQIDNIKKNILGMIGISVMFFYHHKELWLKGRKVIYKLRELKINYTILKGLCDQDGLASRCRVVNVAVEIFLKCGNLSSAVQTLKECDWTINTSLWPCDMMDVLQRHNLLCSLVQEALSKSMFAMCFDILQNLPGFQEFQADLNVSQYAVLFNKVLNACVDNRSMGISSSILDFMIAWKIAIDHLNLQGFISTLAHSGLWTKAREYYKRGMTLGFYPQLEGKMSPNILHLPSIMSEIEMLMTIERFMVLNASSVQSQSGCNQSLQIVLKRMEEDAKFKDRYHAAAERLTEAGRLSNPRLFIKHMTVNKTNEQVYTLDNNCTVKWLNENIKWASNVWH